MAARVQEHGVVQGSATLKVVGKATVPTLGDRAPRSDNYTLSTPGIRAEAIDSRAIDGATVPDRSLHRSTIAGGIAARKPTVVLFSTPTFCVSRFCGPVTNMVEALSSDFADRATFVHVEVWKDFSKSIVNPTAQEWLWQGDGLNEPWLFVIGADGRVLARWDNLMIRNEVVSVLRQLPTG